MPNNLISSHAYSVPINHTFLLSLSTRLSTLNNVVIICLLMVYACNHLQWPLSFFGFTRVAIYTLQYSSLPALWVYCLSFLVINKILSYIKSAYYYQKVQYHISNGDNQISPNNITGQNDCSCTIQVTINTMQTLMARRLYLV